MAATLPSLTSAGRSQPLSLALTIRAILSEVSEVLPSQTAALSISAELPQLSRFPAHLIRRQLTSNSNRVVGSYRDQAFLDHGFIRRRNGTLTFPVDYPGSISTILNGINDQGWIVGSYTDAAGQHGLFRKNANTYVSFDFPGATATSLNGINDFGFIAGRYTDSAGLRHGFVAWVWAF